MTRLWICIPALLMAGLFFVGAVPDASAKARNTKLAGDGACAANCYSGRIGEGLNKAWCDAHCPIKDRTEPQYRRKK
jgi:hypothetical protein